MEYTLSKDKKTITFNRVPKKVKNGVRVLFYREVDERKTHDYPVALADTPKTNKMDWVGCHIHSIQINQPTLLGIFRKKWQVVDNSQDINK